MSTLAKAVKETAQETKSKIVTNYMGGSSYGLSPLETLKIVTASSIFGEPAYYRDGEFADKTVERVRDGIYGRDISFDFSAYDVFSGAFKGMKTSGIKIKVINEALAFDFLATLEWAVTLRKEYFMRLNPQVIMVEAAKHPDRAKFTSENPGVFNAINQRVMSRADEPASQLAYYLYYNKKKNNLPNILKKSWAQKLGSLKPYQVAKYKNAEIGMINTVRVCHATSEVLDELMKTGKVSIKQEEKTWENLRSEGKTWKEILQTIDIGHMALLRNLRNIFAGSEEFTIQETGEILSKLKAGVATGMQFPFRYWSAFRAIKEAGSFDHSQMVLDALEECIDLACNNMPKLKGKTISLSDNSGSAKGAFTSEYGSVKVSEIGNLSSIITAKNADEGYVGIFGDGLKVVSVSKVNGALSQLKQINEIGNIIGDGTENGIWLFFDKAIKNKEHWDNIFIYSDMQAGHGGLYGIHPSEYALYIARDPYIDVMKLVNKYRATVNPKVNVFSVQTAGYEAVLLPEYAYRANVLTGWTGKEIVFAQSMIDFWNKKDSTGGAQ